MFGIDDAALAIMLAGGISTAAGLYTNRKNRESQENANAVNWEIARQNNATQIEMANTAHQREVRDLRAAHLNPILSAGGNGASSPTLSAASIDPVHQDIAFEGLANSAKGLTRYLGEQYKQMQLSNEAQSLSNEMDRQDIDYNRLVRDSEMDQLSADRIQASVNKVAAMSEFGVGLNSNFDGTQSPYISNEKNFRDAVELAREGLRSDLKTRSNSNWRANLSSFVPFTSPAAINSAASVIRGPVSRVPVRRYR